MPRPAAMKSPTRFDTIWELDEGNGWVAGRSGDVEVEDEDISESVRVDALAHRTPPPRPEAYSSQNAKIEVSFRMRW